MHRDSVAAFNVVGGYPTAETARRALAALASAGIDAGQISVEGPEGEEPATGEITNRNMVARDKPMVKHILGRVVLGAIVGALIGVLLEAGLAGAGRQTVPAVGNRAAEFFVFPFMGLLTGMLIGGMTGVREGDAWNPPASEELVAVYVGVHSDEQRDVERAEQVLRQRDVISVEQYEARPAVPQS